MSKLSYVAGVITVLGLLASGATAAPLPDDQVDVTFKEAIGDRFVGVINTVMGTETAKKVNATHYLFRLGPQGDQNDYAVFFSRLPYVKAVQPLPKLAAADRELPNIVIGVDPTTRGVPSWPPRGPAPSPGASGDPTVADNAGPGIYMTPRQITGDTILVYFKSDGPTADVIDQVYGTRAVERIDSGEVRLALPAGMTPMVAARIFRLCPWVLQAEPAYGR